MKERTHKKTPDIQRPQSTHESGISQLKQQQAVPSGIQFTVQRAENKTGMPDHLKSGLENLSGHDLSDVRVHYNSSKPAQLNAHAYAQGNQIHLGPGQEKHLPHEGWHAVQQKQGRVKATTQLKTAEAVEGGEKQSALQTGSNGAPIQGMWNLNPAVGFEFQMLGTNIDFAKKPEPKKKDPKKEESEDEEDGLSFSFGPAEDEVSEEEQKYNDFAEEDKVKNLKAGLNNWHIEKDGKNLEFVTKPYTNLGMLQASMLDLTKTAFSISQTKTPQLININDGAFYVNLKKTGDNAQPQINPDIPLSALSALIEEANEDPVLAQAFEVDGQFGWDKEETANELKDLATAAGAVNGLDVVTLFRITGKAPGEKAADVKGAVLLLAQAVIHEAHYKQHLSKDLPLLHKTNMGALWKSFFDQKIVGLKKGEAATTLKEIISKLPIEDLGEEKKIIASFVDEVIKTGKDPVWPRDTAPVEMWDPPKKEEDKPKSGKKKRKPAAKKKTEREHFSKQILVELRRVPQVAVKEWYRFAVKWYKYFVEFYKVNAPSPQEQRMDVHKKMATLGKSPARKVGGMRIKGKKK